MKFRKLLAGTAVAALMGSNAFALSISLSADSANSPGNVAAGLVAATVIEAPVNIAQETNLASTTFNNGAFAIQVNTDGLLSQANNYYIRLEVVNGTFRTQVAADDVQTSPTPSAGATALTFNGRNVEFNGGTRTGLVGSNSVEFLASAAAQGNEFIIVADVAATCAGPLTFNVRLQTELRNNIEQGQVTLPTPAATCVDAYRVSIADDTRVAGGGDSELLASNNFQTLRAGVAAPAGLNDSTTEATVGTATYAFNPTGAATIFASLSDAEDNASNLNSSAAAINNVTLQVTPTQTAGIVGLGPRVAGGTTTALTNGSANFTIDPSTTSANNDIEVQIAGNVTLQPTDFTVNSAVVSFVSGELSNENAVFPFGTSLDELGYEGDICGNFDWVGDSNTARRNVFRATGGNNAFTQGIFATISNPTNAVTGLTTRRLPANPDLYQSPTGSEIQFSDITLTQAFGNYGRADFSFNFISSNGVDCDRLQSQPVNAVVTDFGNGTGNNASDGDDN